MTSEPTWVLAIDFGTTNTVAAVADHRGTRILTINGRPVMPSAVLFSRGRWTVGERANNMARGHFDCYERTPKRLIPDRTIFLDGKDVDVADAISAVLSVVVSEAAKQQAGPPTAFVVTHPAVWSDSRVDVLKRAATQATSQRGWPTPITLAEPVAAAQQLLHTAGIPTQGRFVVLDLGGGTVDVTVVDRDGEALRIVGRPTGRDELGGEDFDLRLVRWMVQEAGVPGLYERLLDSDDEDRERAAEMRRYARDVKEELSEETYVAGIVRRAPPALTADAPVMVNKGDLEGLIRGGRDREPGLTEAVELVRDALNDAPTGPPLVGVLLVGGSARIPLLGNLITQKVGKPPLSKGDPTTAVADGAARHVWTYLHRRSNREDDARVPSGARTGPPPPPINQVPPPGPPPGPPPPRRRRRRRRALLAAMLTLLVIAGAGVAAVLIKRNADQRAAGDAGATSYSSPTDSPATQPTSPSSDEFGPTGGTTPATVPVTTTLRSVDECLTSYEANCPAVVQSASLKVWPTINLTGAGQNCLARQDGSLLYTECALDAVKYDVYWGEAGTRVVQSFASEMPDANISTFSLTGGENLGSEVAGYWKNSAGSVYYVCVWGYSGFPVAMAIAGSSPDAVTPLCTTARFYGSSKMSAEMDAAP